MKSCTKLTKESDLHAPALASLHLPVAECHVLLITSQYRVQIQVLAEDYTILKAPYLTYLNLHLGNRVL